MIIYIVLILFLDFASAYYNYGCTPQTGMARKQSRHFPPLPVPPRKMRVSKKIAYKPKPVITLSKSITRLRKVKTRSVVPKPASSKPKIVTSPKPLQKKYESEVTLTPRSIASPKSWLKAKRPVVLTPRVLTSTKAVPRQPTHPPPEPIVNLRPIIGILAQELSPALTKCLSDLMLSQYHSYIAASYVKYIEAAGARVVPIK